MAFGTLLSDRVKKRKGSELDSERFDYIALDNAEPDFGIPDSDDAFYVSNTDGTRRFATKQELITKAFIDGLGVDADTLDSLNSAQFLRSDVADRKTEGDLGFDEQVKATFGADDNFQIYHSGDNGFIDDVDVGGIRIRTDDVLTISRYSTSGKLAKFGVDSSVELYYDDALKFKTTDSGTRVFGSVVIDNDLTVGDSAEIVGNAAVHGSLHVGGNISTNGYIAGPDNFVVDPDVGNNDGTLIVRGNLQVEGTTTVVNSTTVSVDDKNLSLGDSTADSATVDGGGLTLLGANATITYNAGTDHWDFNKPVQTPDLDVSDSVGIGGSASIGGNLNVFGTALVSQSFTVTDSALVTSNLDVYGQLNVGDSSRIRNNLSVADNLLIGNDVVISDKFRINNDGTHTYITEIGNDDLKIRSNSLKLENLAGGRYLSGTSEAAVELFYNDNKKIETTNTGGYVTGNLEVRDKLIADNVLGDSGTFTLLTRSGATDYSGIYGSATEIPVVTVDASGFIDSIGTVAVAGVDSTSWDSSTSSFVINTADGNEFRTIINGFYDNQKLFFGTGNDYSITFDGSDFVVGRENDTSGTFKLVGNTSIQSSTGENLATFAQNGRVSLYYDNALKLQTESDGITVTGDVGANTGTFTSISGNLTGNVDGDSGDLRTFTADNITTRTALFDSAHFYNNAKLYFGDANELEIYHDGSASVIKENGSGNLDLQGTNISLLSGPGEQMGYFQANGSVSLYYDNDKKFETTTTGATIRQQLLIDSADDTNTGLLIRNSSGAQVKQYFTGSGATDNYVITRVGTGGSEINLTNAGAVLLSHGANIRLATTPTGVTITGGLVADSATIGQATISGSISADSAVVNGVTLNRVTSYSQEAGALFFDSDPLNALSFIPITNEGATDVTINVGQENVIYVHNLTGEQINNGEVVYISGTAHGEHAQVSKAQANTAIAGTIALATMDIPDNAHGWVTRFGLVRDVNTGGLTAGADVYLSKDSAGQWTTNEVSVDSGYPYHIGKVIRVDSDTGSILVDPFTEHFEYLRIEDKLRVTGPIVATGDVSAKSITFDGTDPGYSEGTVFYDSANGALAFYNDEADITLQIGQENYSRVYNNSGATIENGSVIRYSGADAATGLPTVAKAQANSVAGTTFIAGIATHDIENGTIGYVTTFGSVGGLNTSSFAVGSPVYLSPDSAGKLVDTPPGFPNYPILVGGVLTSDSNDGRAFVKIENEAPGELRVKNDARVDGDLTIGGNLNLIGAENITQVNNLQVSDNFVYIGAGDTVITSFAGSGLNDATIKDYYEGDSSVTYNVEITSTDSSGDTIKWYFGTDSSGLGFDSAGGPTSWNLGTDGNTNIPLRYNITIDFVSTTGHTTGDRWFGDAAPVNVDLGIVGNYNTPDAPYTHAGIFRDASDQKFKFFNKYDPEVEGSINTADSSFELAIVQAETFEGDLTGNVTGNASTASLLETSRTIAISGDITGTATSFNGGSNITISSSITSGSIVNDDINANAAIVDTKLATISTSGKVQNSATTATSANTASAIVARDALGNFSANLISANFEGDSANIKTISADTLIGRLDYSNLDNVPLKLDSAAALEFLSTLDSDAVSAIILGDVTKTFVDALNIDADTLDSLNSTQFLRSDSADIKTAGNLRFNDNVKATFGTSDDLEIYHDGSNSIINDNDVGNLHISRGGTPVIQVTDYGADVTGGFTADSAVIAGLNYPTVDGDPGQVIRTNGAGQLEFVSISALQGGLDSADVLAIVDSDYVKARVDHLDNEKLTFGDSGDLEIYHDATHSYIKDGGTGNLKVLTSSLAVKNAADTETMLTATENGAVVLYHNDNDRLATTNSGIDVKGSVVVGLNDDVTYDGTTAIIGSPNAETLTQFSATSYSGGKFVITANQGSKGQISELLVTHNGTNAYATEYAFIATDSDLATFDVDISGGNVRILATITNNQTTNYSVAKTLMRKV